MKSKLLKQKNIEFKLGVGRVSMIALFALVENRLSFIDGTHLHGVETKLGVVTLGARLLDCCTTHSRVHMDSTLVFLNENF